MPMEPEVAAKMQAKIDGMGLQRLSLIEQIEALNEQIAAIRSRRVEDDKKEAELKFEAARLSADSIGLAQAAKSMRAIMEDEGNVA